MICPKCTNKINDKFYCDTCKMEVLFYKKIIDTSNWLYNNALKKAKVHDLTSAIDYLKYSLKYDKKNLKARNLLGLVYFEIGEIVLALEQWVICRNIDPEDSISEKYLLTFKNNQHQVDKCNTAIKKYNQALVYVEQGNYDLAIIQLKKVISLNTNFVKAYCLLALLLINGKEYESASKYLLKVLTIDKSNYTANYYYDFILKETKQIQDPLIDNERITHDNDQNNKISNIKNFLDDKFTYGHQIMYILIGLIVGIALYAFLINPTKNADLNKQITKYKSEITELKNKQDENTTALKDKVKKLEGDLANQSKENDEEYLVAMGNLNKASRLYIQNDKQAAKEVAEEINPEVLKDEESINLLKEITQENEETDGKSAREYYVSGLTLYKQNNFQEAIELLMKAPEIEPESDAARDSLYFTARSYQKSGDNEKALEYFNRVVEEFPGTKAANDAKNWINQLSD